MEFLESRAFIGFSILILNGIIAAEYALTKTTANLNLDMMASPLLAKFLLSLNITTNTICIIAVPVTAFIYDGLLTAIVSFILWITITSLFSKALNNNLLHFYVNMFSMVTAAIGWYFVVTSWLS